ncbi:MAG: exonuclease SbcCD subunit D [Dehalococcoidia bacterium]|nr:exonuclease SbcCD subunit D [Dehalococcoidia bacterium]
MKLLHFSDLHIGVENYGRPDPDTGLSTRLLDFLAAFDELVDYAIAARVDAVLFAGDAYKSRDPSQTHQREFARRIARLAAEGIPVFLVTGNHDLPAIAGRASALDIFPTLAIERVFVADHISTTILPTRAGPLQIVALPWIRRSQFLTRDDTRNLTLDQITQRLQERLTNALTQELQRLDPNLPAVLVAHVTVSGATVGTERSMMLGRDHVILLSALATPALDYVALGHVHKHQVLGYNPTVAYSGSLQRVDFSEEAEDKGFCMIDLDENQPPGSRLRRFDFHPVKARPFLTIDVDVPPGDDDPTQRVLDTIARKYVTDAIVRVRIHLPEELESRLRESDIRDALSAAHYVAAIQRDVTRSRRTRLTPESSRGLGPREALRLYLESRSTDPQRMDVLLSHADALLREELGEEPE